MATTAMEKLKNITQAVREHLARLEGGKREVPEIEGRLGELKTAIIKARALKDPSLPGLESEEARLVKRKAELERETQEASSIREILEKEHREATLEAKRELLEEYWPAFEKVIRGYLKKLREAEAEEKDLWKLRAEAEMKFTEAGGMTYAGVLPPLSRLLTEPHVLAAGKDGAKIATTVDMLSKELADLGVELPSGLAFKGVK